MITLWKQNKFYLSFLIPVLLFSAAMSEIFAKDIIKYGANTGFQLLENPVNPRFIAMGSAGSASIGTGFSYYNPALPFLIGTSYLTAEYGQYPRADLKRAHLEGIVFLEGLFFGISFHTESVEDIIPANVWGNLPGYDKPFSWQFTNISLNFGFSKWEDIAFALNLNAMQDRIENEYAYAYTVSAGAVFIPIPDRLTLGLSLLNYGTSTPMLGSDNKKYIGKGEDIPMNSRLGITWTHSLKEIPYSVALDVVYRNVRDRDKSFKKNIRDRFTAPFGLEIKPVPPLSIRLGKRFNLSTEIINFGMGFNLDFLHVDLSVVIPRHIDDSEIKWLTAITYYLRKKNISNKMGKQKQQNNEDIPQVDTTQVENKSGSGSKQDTPADSIQTDIESREVISDPEDYEVIPSNPEDYEEIRDPEDYTDTKDTLLNTDSISEQNEIEDSIIFELLDNPETTEEPFINNNPEKD